MSQAARKEVDNVPAMPVVSARLLLGMGISLALLVAAGYAAQSFRRATNFPINKVMVEGDFRYLTPGYIQSLVSRSLHGGFFQVNVQEIRKALLEEPWVMEATIERRWPDVIRVAINEQQPAARWGEHALINTAADVFAPRSGTFPRDLPRLNGPVGSEQEVLNTFRTVSSQVRPLGLTVAWVDLSERGAWTVGLNGGIQLILGRHRLEERLRRFNTAFELALKEAWPKVKSIDLRYTNGFAIREHKLAETGRAQEKRGG